METGSAQGSLTWIKANASARRYQDRDAGLIIHSAEAAAYFEQIFLHDWDHLASPVAAG